jgi:hypothetical protein
MANEPIGRTLWVVPEGYLPDWSSGPEPELASHGSLSVLNTGPDDAHIEITIYYSDRDPVGPYRRTVPAQRTQHLRFNALDDPEPVPTATEFSSVVRSDVPVVVQHTRLDSRQDANALMTTLAWPG